MQIYNANVMNDYLMLWEQKVDLIFIYQIYLSIIVYPQIV